MLWRELIAKGRGKPVTLETEREDKLIEKKRARKGEITSRRKRERKQIFVSSVNPMPGYFERPALKTRYISGGEHMKRFFYE